MKSSKMRTKVNDFQEFREEKIVAVVNDTNTQILLKTFLKNFGFREFEVFIGRISDIISRLQIDSSPNHLIVDISGETSPVDELEKMARHCSSHVNVLLLGLQDNIALYRELIALGAIDYLIKPPSEKLLTIAMERMINVKRDPQSGRQKGKVVGILGTRGGVGSTAAVLNLGHVFADKYRNKVALVDLNVNDGTLALDMGLQPSSGFQDLIEDASRIDDVFVKRASRHLGDRLSIYGTDGGYVCGTSVDLETALRLLVILRAQYEIILLDVPRLPVETMMSILDAVDTRIFVMNRSVASVRNCERLLSLFPGSNGLKNLVVINDLRVSRNHEVPLAKIRSFMGRPVDVIVPEDQVPVWTAGLSDINMSGTNRVILKAYVKVANLIAGPLPKPKQIDRWIPAFLKG
jgi:pilus assembly protein CpaE